jgi:hypothetical protein
MRQEMARLTLATKIATIVLIVWKRGVGCVVFLVVAPQCPAIWRCEVVITDHYYWSMLDSICPA